MKKLIIKKMSLCLFVTFCMCILGGCFFNENLESNTTTNNSMEIEESHDENFVVTEEAEKSFPTYILNINSKKIHKTSCGTGKSILPENKKSYTGDIETLYSQGYTKCGNCFRGE